jgi:prevent-host-death family protein
MRVNDAQLIERYADLADRVPTEPVTITENGVDRLVLLSVHEYERLKRRDRRSVLAEEFSDADLDLIAQAEVPPEFAHLDTELVDEPRP